MAVRMKLNRPGFRRLRQSVPVKRELEERAQRIADHAGDGYEMSSRTGKTRARASVITGNFEAIKDNARHNTLLRSVMAGRGS